MEKPLVCHNPDNDFLDALEACLASGLSIWVDGVPQSQDMLPHSLLREDAEWVGNFLRDENGDLQGISLSDLRRGNTLLP